MKPAAFRATYSDWKLVKTRQVVQIVFEVPLADADAAYDVIGGMPDPSKERWFGIAPLNSEMEVMPNSRKPSRLSPGPDNAMPHAETKKHGARRDWRDMLPTQQAGIRCDDPTFVAFLREQHTVDWREAKDAADFVRGFCGVASRSELVTNHKARVLWHQLDEQFQAWKAVEHA